MVRGIFGFTLWLLPWAFVTASAGETTAETIRVRLLAKQSSIELRGFGIRLNRSDAVHVETLPVKSIWQIARVKDYFTIKRIGKNGESLLRKYAVNEIQISGDELHLNGNAIPQSLQIVATTQNGFDVVTKLDIENYLLGVLPAEMPASWPMDALKAQVIAARTYAMAVKRERLSAHFDVESTVLHQVYRWAEFHGASDTHRNRILAAVGETRGLFLKNGSRIYKSHFHAHCGGETEDAQNVWGGGLSKRSTKNLTVKDKGCMTESPNNWEISYTLHELGNILRQNNVIGAENVRHIEVTSWTPHGRIAKLKVTDENENIYDISANDLRAWAGYTRIKSTKFEIKLSKDSVQFSGSGFGHGVGMCQTGARLMALAGSDFRTILKRYYPDAQLNTSATVAASH